MKLVIDTSILIDYLRGGKKWEDVLGKLDKDTELYLPTIVIFELFSGKSTTNPDTASKINAFLKFFQKVELDERIARRAGELFRDMNKNLGAPDYIIAACAIELNATLLTLNTAHFAQITHLTLYPV